MKALLTIFGLMWRDEHAALWRGLILSIIVLVAGAALLGLSGWFITAAGAAGLAGIGIAFDVFRPSAGVRMLALGRTAARYGERLLTHDATLRALAKVRVRLFEGLAEQSYDALARLRSPVLLNRVIADVDVLDGVAIRLVFPLLAGVVTMVLAFAALAWLTTLALALVVVGILSVCGLCVMVWLGRAALAPAARAECERQSLSAAVMEHLKARSTLTFAGTLPVARRTVLDVDARAREAEQRIAQLDREAGALVSVAGTVAAAAALLVGGGLALTGTIAPAVAAIGVFCALGLVEVLMPLQRAVAEVGRMHDAAQRVAPVLSQTLQVRQVEHPVAHPSEPNMLRVRALSVSVPGTSRPLLPAIDLNVAAGQMLALTGRSGRGKSTLLATLAGLCEPLSGEIEICGYRLDMLKDADLRNWLGFLPQRSQLVSGSLYSNLTLAAPDASERDMLEMLNALALLPVVVPRGGLDMVLGEGGTGLSGGETRRLALARVLLRKPRVLLLDEPTEGIDEELAANVMAAIRAAVPEAAIVVATHRPSEVVSCDHLIQL